MNILDLYKKLDKIFVDHTTHKWKNGWEHEGDRKDNSLQLKLNIPWNNLFLLTKDELEINLQGPRGFKIEIVSNGVRLRIDIEAGLMSDSDIYYYVDNEQDWLDTSDFIVDLCQKVYDSNVKLKESLSVVPNGIYGEVNPQFTKIYRRDRILNDLEI